ncbi:MAG: TlpA family protein disulfide reductase [Candidatus Eremiobacteraeota bacterium]|nr:TlpA family protein disulfide reductase [Candidatus Eremiobacteraeota bacterium]
MTRTIRILASAGIAVAALCTNGPADARRHDAGPATGLRNIRLRAAAPDFAYDTGAGPARLSNLTGRIVVLNFWATWCEPCRDELDVLSRVRAAYGAEVEVLTISDEAPGVARAFLLQRQLAFAVVEDPGRKIFSAYGVEPIPVTLVVGAHGIVRHVSVGQLDWAELSSALEEAGAGSGAAAASNR